MSSRGTRLSDALSKDEINEIAATPAGVVGEAVNLATKPAAGLEAPTKADEPKVKVNIATIGKDGKAEFSDAKNLEDFDKLK